jgi:hypothetical protein
VGVFPIALDATESFAEITAGGATGPPWSSADAAPTAVELRPSGNKLAIEIDCIVPFVIPN